MRALLVWLMAGRENDFLPVFPVWPFGWLHSLALTSKIVNFTKSSDQGETFPASGAVAPIGWRPAVLYDFPSPLTPAAGAAKTARL